MSNAKRAERAEHIFMNIREALSAGQKTINSDTKLLDCEVLLSAALGRTREYIVAHPEAHLTPNQEKKYKKLLSRRARGEPIAYLTGEKEFFGLRFLVSPACLIPRPETELLCETAIEIIRKYNFSRVCDVGTGSGAIAIALAANLPEIHITATDISKKALSIARKNAKFHNVEKRIAFRHCDLLPRANFDVIVANLPYLSENDPNVSREVRKYEPDKALVSGEDGLDEYRRLFALIAHQRPAYLIGEFGFGQASAIKRLACAAAPGAKVIFKNDLAGIPRVFIVKYSQNVG